MRFIIIIVEIIIVRPKKKILVPKIKCTTLLKQLYCMYYNTRPKSAPEGCHHSVFSPCWVVYCETQESKLSSIYLDEGVLNCLVNISNFATIGILGVMVR
jgi:hypothetical protein